MRLEASTLALALGCALSGHAQQPPNVLLITVDDMNWDSVGVYGAKIENLTPNIDRLAREGLRFEHAHVTIAICQPTRAVWMTGRLSLFNLEDDIGETTDVSAENPEVVERLLALAEEAREELGDSLTGRSGSGVRAPAH